MCLHRFVGSYLTTHGEFCFVLEDAAGQVCGYAVAAADARDHNRKLEMAWLPAMQEKYPKTDRDDRLTPAEVRARDQLNVSSSR